MAASSVRHLKARTDQASGLPKASLIGPTKLREINWNLSSGYSCQNKRFFFTINYLTGEPIILISNLQQRCTVAKGTSLSGHDNHESTSKSQVFDDTFAADERETLMAEDSEAWNGVVALLIFIVSVGVTLMTATVFIGR